MTVRIISSFCLLAVLFSSGCKDRQITSYRAPKDPAPPAKSMAASGNLPPDHPPIGQPAGDNGMAGSPVATASGNSLVWSAPATWQPKAPGSVRKGSYSVPGESGAVGDVAITAFPGDTGGLFANVNRWRGQVGLPPIAQSELVTAVEHIDLNGFHVELVELLGNAGGQPTRVLGAIVPHNGQTWFFKLTGPDALVAAQTATFREFLATIKPAAGTP